jgi:isopropanol dehydrogenase (NADP+)
LLRYDVDGIYGSENGEIPIGGTVAVFALGPIGLMAVAGARLRGAGLVIGVDSVPKRQELARFYGADVIVDFTQQDAVARIMELTGGQGVDCAVEALGAELSF